MAILVVMPTSVNVEIAHGISGEADKILISVTVGFLGMCRYCKVTLHSVAFLGL